MKANIDRDIKNEVKRRKCKQKEHLFTADQYTILRLGGLFAHQVVDLEKQVRDEIAQRKAEQGFLETAWVHHRVMGKLPEQIQHNDCHALM